MSNRTWFVTFAIGILLLALLPNVVDGYMLGVMRDALIFGLFAASLDFFWGRTGILCFGHACFFGLGGYVMAIVSMMPDLAQPTLFGLVAAVAASALLAAVIGYFMFFGGVRGSYFTIVTLALAVIAQQVAVSWSDVTGGDTGSRWFTAEGETHVPAVTAARFVDSTGAGDSFVAASLAA